jgi:RNA polymerase sporulation-specific sigma factor
MIGWPDAAGQLTDEHLVAVARDGHEQATEAIFRRYEWLVRSRARAFFLQGAEYDDLIQEGMIGLYKAVRDFQVNSASFRSFAELCVTRQIITAVKTASRQKHVPLNSAFSLDAPRYQDDGDRTMCDTIHDSAVGFDATLLQNAEVQVILQILRKRLSIFEYRALRLWLEGLSYDEIARNLRKHVKSVDNGLWRVKCKIRRLLKSGVIPKSE